MQLTELEAQLLQKPLAEMDKQERQMAIMAWEKRNASNWSENDAYRAKQKAAYAARFKDAA